MLSGLAVFSDLWERLKAQIGNVEILKFLLNAVLIMWRGPGRRKQSILLLFSELQNKSTLLLEFAMFICLLITGFDTLYGFYLVFNGILPIDL